MKKNFLKLICLSMLTIGAVSCSSSDDATVIIEPNPNDPENPNPNPDPNPQAKFVHKTLIEDVTGAWCQWCPRVTHAIELATSHATLGDKVIPVAVHYGDVMQISAGNVLNNFFNVDGYPFAIINRGSTWESPENNKLAQVYNSINQNGSPVGIKISSDLTNNGGTITASFKFNEGYQGLKYVAYIIENEVIRTDDPQKNSTSFFGGISPNPNFIHNDVLMAVAGNARGNDLGDVTTNSEIVKSNQAVQYTLNNNDLSKVEVVVFVTDSTGKNVLNVQKAKANETVDYQML